MAPPAYKDFAKIVTSIFKDDFEKDRKVVVKSKAAAMSFKVENVLKAGNLAGYVETKYAHPSGVSIDKLKMEADGKVGIEATIAKMLAPGMDMYYKGDFDFKGKVGVNYKDAMVNAQVEGDVPDMKALSVNAVASMDDISVGGMAQYGLSGDKTGLTDYNVAVGYSQKAWFAALATENKMATFKAYGFWAPCPPATVGAQLTMKPETGATTVELGTTYACNPTTTIRVKASSEGKVAAAFAQKCGKNLSVGAAAEVPVTDFSKVTYGAVLTLG